MKLRSLTATVGAFAASVALVVGLAAPASAGPILPPVVFPTCATIVPPSIVSAWGLTPSAPVPFGYGASAPTLTAIIATNRDVTCSWTNGGHRSVMSEVAISSADYTTIRAWYLANGYTAHAAGTGTTPGSPFDTVFFRGSPKGTGVAEVAFLSPYGWWITVRDDGAGTIGSFTNEAVIRFLELNPRR